MSRSIWKTLDVAATTDMGAIRKAYAKRLKVTNPEDDPAGFQALREAYETAIDRARRQVVEDDEDTEGLVVTIRPEVDDETPSPTRPERSASRPVRVADAAEETVFEEHDRRTAEDFDLRMAREVEREALNGACGALFELVTAETPPDRDEVRRRGEAILALPAMDDVILFGQVEQWLSELIARNVPRADLLIEPAAKRFGWSGQTGQIHSSPAVEYLLRRLADVEYRNRISRRGHAFAKAFALVAEPVQPGSARWMARAIWSAGDVTAMLHDVERLYPGVLVDFDQDSLAWWRAYLAGPRIGLAPIMAGGLLAGLGLVSGLASQSLAVTLVLGPSMAMTWLGLYAMVHFGIRRPRHLWLTGAGETAPDWIRVAWAPAMLACLLLSTLFAGLPMMQWVLLGTLAIPLAWIWVVSDPRRRRWGDSGNSVIWPNGILLLGTFLMAMAPPSGAGVCAFLASALAGMAFAGGREPLERYWRGAGLRVQNAWLAAGGVAMLATLLLAAFAHGPVLQALGIAAAAMAVLVVRTPVHCLPTKVEELVRTWTIAAIPAGLCLGGVLMRFAGSGPYALPALGLAAVGVIGLVGAMVGRRAKSSAVQAQL